MQSSEVNANKENICKTQQHWLMICNVVILASLQFISDKVRDNFNRGNNEHQGSSVERCSRKGSKSGSSKFQNSLQYIFLPGHVRGLVQREAKDSKGREGGIWQTVSREVVEPVIWTQFDSEIEAPVEF